MGKVIGIDLGTTNSVVAVIEGGKPVVVANSEGSYITPSVVAINKDGDWLVGGIANRQATINPENTVFSIKRFVGRRYDDPAIQHDIRLAPYKIKAANDGGILVNMGEKWYSPPEILAIVLRKMKRTAEDYLGEPVSDAVITVPAYFNDSQRQSIKEAGRIAGLKVLRIINEPTAASLAYWLDKKKEQYVAVYHLGGGTLDISILQIGDNVFEVKSTNGDTHLGGDDFDQCVIDWICDEFEKKEGVDLRYDRGAFQRLKKAAEWVKCELSSAPQADINLSCISGEIDVSWIQLQRQISTDIIGPNSSWLTLTRDKLGELVSDLIEKTLVPFEKALKDAHLTTVDIDEVILIGQQTRMPAVGEAVEKFFGRDPSFGVVNPAEVVAMGAAIQGGIFTGDIKDVLLLDVTPLSLGIETSGGVFNKLIERNSTIPTKKSHMFSTVEDNQTAVSIHVLQGEQEMAADNKSLGRFNLVGIPPAPRGVPQVEVTFDIDANGILHASAKDLGSSKEQTVKIIASTSPGELSKAVVEKAQTQNDAEAMIDEVKKALIEKRDCLPSDIGGLVRSKVSILRRILWGEGENVSEIQRITQELSIVRKCIVVLGESCDEKAVEMLAELLKTEEDKQSRRCIRQALREIGGAKVNEVLRPRTRTDKLLRRRRWVDK